MLWSEEEIRLIKELYPTKAARKKLRELLSAKTAKQIKSKARMLGVAGFRKVGPNRYETRGRITLIYLHRQDGSEPIARISTRDRERVLKFGRWKPHDTPYTTYVRCGLTYLHRFLLGCTDNEEGDHRNANGLDNTRRNLRKVVSAANKQNQSVFSRIARSGHRNVHVDKYGWIVRIQVGKYRDETRFTVLQDAIEFAKIRRRQLHPFLAPERDHPR